MVHSGKQSAHWYWLGSQQLQPATNMKKLVFTLAEKCLQKLTLLDHNHSMQLYHEKQKHNKQQLEVKTEEKCMCNKDTIMLFI